MGELGRGCLGGATRLELYVLWISDFAKISRIFENCRDIVFVHTGGIFGVFPQRAGFDGILDANNVLLDHS